MPEQRYPVGVDLGTTFSSISYVDENGRVETVRMEDGGFAIASAVYVRNEREVIVGNDALQYCVVDASRVARAFKRQMGVREWTFQAGDRVFRAEELSAMVLKKLVQQAELQIGPIEEVVVSVPFIFDEVRRRATEHAAQIAGLRIVDIVDEPVAAALAYGHTLLKSGGFYNNEELDNLFRDGVILVYDLGGGTFDLTLMRLKNDYSFEVLATDGDPRLGGEDWDDELVKFLEQKYTEIFGRHPGGNPELAQELRLKATEAKMSLSERPRVSVEMTCQQDAKTVEIARGAFEKMTGHLVERTRLTLESMLNKKDMGYSHIDFILLIGGSCRMPMISKMLERETQRRLDMSLPPDTAVSSGAALFAALRTGHKSMTGIKIKTVNPHALGLLAYHRSRRKQMNDVLINANEPTETVVRKCYPVKEGAREIELVVLQGDLPDPHDCVKLGEVAIPQLTAEILEGATVDITFSIQQNGLLQVKSVVRPRDPQMEPIETEFKVKVEGSMSNQQVLDAETTLAGIMVE